ncbi:hypothetical protein S40288_10715 [Stachybotrys chartarum IBT 40288]|nr:hypothetical protein S40288_10715 [Stachybotrys chartarum IBT 40288]
MPRHEHQNMAAVPELSQDAVGFFLPVRDESNNIRRRPVVTGQAIEQGWGSTTARPSCYLPAEKTKVTQRSRNLDNQHPFIPLRNVLESSPYPITRSTVNDQAPWDYIPNTIIAPGVEQHLWEDHCSHVVNFLTDLSTGVWAANDDLVPMLKPVLRGLEPLVATPEFPIYINADDDGRLQSFDIKSTPFESYDKEGARWINVGSYGSFDGDPGLNGADQLPRVWFGKRFYVSFIHWGKHWTSFIWDRYRKSFYHFDSWKRGEKARLNGAVQMWRQQLRLAGFPTSFDYVQVPITYQPGEWQCGYLSLYCIWMTLRGLVGITVEELKQSDGDFTHVPARDVPIDQPSTGKKIPLGKFDLRIRDWVQTNNGPEAEFETVRHFFYLLGANELGLSNYHSMPFTTQGQEQIHWDLGSWLPTSEDGLITRAQNCTTMGGYCPSIHPSVNMKGFYPHKRDIAPQHPTTQNERFDPFVQYAKYRPPKRISKTNKRICQTHVTKTRPNYTATAAPKPRRGGLRREMKALGLQVS